MSRRRKQQKEAGPRVSAGAVVSAPREHAGTESRNVPAQPTVLTAAGHSQPAPVPRSRKPLYLAILLTAAWFVALLLLVVFTSKPVEQAEAPALRPPVDATKPE